MQMKTTNTDTPSLTYIGHASIKIKTKNNTVIYIDPAAPGNYDEAADIILVTHSHEDHNKVSLVTTKDATQTILFSDSLKNGVYKTFDISGVKVQAVSAYNKNHSKDSSVGYILEFDGIKVYHAGDTDNIEEMKNLSSQRITYALFPTDGSYNMGPKEAKDAAKVVNAKYSIPIHTSKFSQPYNDANADAFSFETTIIVKPEDTIHLGS